MQNPISFDSLDGLLVVLEQASAELAGIAALFGAAEVGRNPTDRIPPPPMALSSRETYGVSILLASISGRLDGVLATVEGSLASPAERHSAR